MPLLVRCEELQEGMRLTEAFTWAGRIMLPAGKVLGKDDLDSLRRRHPDVTLKVGDPLLDTLVEFEDDARDRDIAVTAQQRIVQSMKNVQERFTQRTAAGAINYVAIKNAAASVLEYLKNNPVSAALINRNSDPKSYLSEHTGNVFYLCMVLGTAVRDYVMRERMRQTAASNLAAPVAMNLLPLGLGAMFMDLGMYPLQHVFAEGYQLTDADRQAIKNHPISGADMLPDDLPAGVKMTVRTHHENFDGKGYPSAMSGASQHVFTRIIRICDAFDAASAVRVYRDAKSPARVLWEMCAGPWRKCFDPVLTKVFMSLIQPFPVGAKLKLADGRYAAVVRYNRKVPFKPSVIIAFNKDGHSLPKEALEGPLVPGEGNEHRLAYFGDENLDYIYDPNMEPIDLKAADNKTLLDMAYP